MSRRSLVHIFRLLAFFLIVSLATGPGLADSGFEGGSLLAEEALDGLTEVPVKGQLVIALERPTTVGSGQVDQESSGCEIPLPTRAILCSFLL